MDAHTYKHRYSLNFTMWQNKLFHYIYAISTIFCVIYYIKMMKKERFHNFYFYISAFFFSLSLSLIVKHSPSNFILHLNSLVTMTMLKLYIILLLPFNVYFGAGPNLFNLKYKTISMFICFFFCSKLRPEDLIQYTITDKKDKRAPKAHVNAVFFRQLRELLRKFILFL